MDTGSLYLAFSKPTLEKVVKSDMVNKFYVVYASWFPSEVCPAHNTAFIRSVGVIHPENCVAYRDRKRFDKRSPDLFKLEDNEDGIIFLCSKTYRYFGK